MEIAILAISILGLILLSYVIAKVLEVQKQVLALTREVTALKRTTESLEKTVAHHSEMLAEQHRKSASLPSRQQQHSDPIIAFLQGIPQLKNAKWLPLAVFAAKQITDIVRSKTADKKASKGRRGMLNE